jgi:NAD(P)-dependent dehydrogenase (short-subunit alcohol dehydrogenase family)
MSGSLQGKVAIVTGGGRGIGRAFVLGLAREGASIVAADLDAPNAAESAELARQLDAPALGLEVDVAQRSSVLAMIEQARTELGGIDILINDAGIYPRSTFLEMDEALWDRVIDTNLKGTFLCSQAAARLMVEQGRGGRIINLASRAAFVSHVRGPHYSASKAGIVALTRAMALELGPHRITANLIAPGATNTAMPRLGQSEEQLFAAGSRIPLGRIAEPEDMVPAMLFIVGEGGAYITGQTLHVNGGDLMR